MSLYSQNLYGQPSYAGTSYRSSPPAHSGYYYNQPPPHPPAPAVYEFDAASFRREFARRLRDLTFNSRPIIQQLSMFAQEYARFSDIVGQCIKAHIREVSHFVREWYFASISSISLRRYMKNSSMVRCILV